MNSTDLLRLLLETTLAGSAAVLLVLALRVPVRRWLGASAAYLLWLAVPAAWLAVLLPSPRIEAVPMAMVGGITQVGVAVADTTAPMLRWSVWLAAAWVCGALAMAFWLLRQQRRFVRELGPLQRRADGCWQSPQVAGLPAVIGVLRPKIVLPAGFEQRYEMHERQLVLLHEQVHLRRGDIVVNALLALVQCAHWFNPLLVLAMRRCREDQELSCDERVIAHSAGARRSYAAAMLKTGLAASPLPVGCHWQNQHPLKERIAMLKRPVPGKKQWGAMVVLAVGLSSAVGYVAWAAQPAQAGAALPAASYYSVKLRLDVDGEARNFEVREREGRLFAFTMKTAAGREWAGEFRMDRLDADMSTLSGTLSEGGKVVASPSLSVKDGHEANMGVSNRDGSSLFKMGVLITGAQPGSNQAARQGSISAEPETVRPNDPQAVNMSPPKYPPSMNTGEVLLQIDVAADGSVAGVAVERSSGHADLDEAAMAAASKWTFIPGHENGVAVARKIRVPVRFDKDETLVETESSTS